MHKLIRTGLLIAGFTVAAFGTAQPALSSEQWQEDLDFLQRTVHNDFSFLFKKTTAEAFDAQVAEIRDSIPVWEPHQILAGFHRLISSFEYGHTSMGGWEEVVPRHRLPMVLYDFSDGVYIQGVHRDYAEWVGARLVAVEGVDVQTALERIRPLVPAENDMFMKAYGTNYIAVPEFLHAQGITRELRTEVSLTLERDGKENQVSMKAIEGLDIPRRYGMVVPGEDWVDARESAETPLYLKHLDSIYFYEYLPEQKTVYVRQSQIQDQEGRPIPEFYQEVFDFIDTHEVQRMILDVRLNGGGNNYKNKPIVTGVIRNEKINQVGKFFVIIGRRTFSACQNLVNELHTYTNAVFVGEPTGENINFYGDNRPVTFPNSGLKAYLSVAWWQDKPQWENEDWLTPQVSAAMTFEQYRTGADPALDAALAFTDNTYIVNPMEYLTQLFTQGDVAAVQSEAARMIADPNYRYFDFEGNFDEAANNLLQANRLDEAYYVAEMNIGFFPESARTWLRKGEVLAKKGQVDEARSYFAKAVELEPDSEAARKAGEYLKL